MKKRKRETVGKERNRDRGTHIQTHRKSIERRRESEKGAKNK